MSEAAAPAPVVDPPRPGTPTASIEPSGSSWYVGGTDVCHSEATADARTNIIANMAVYAETHQRPAP
jgi:hypothetical protein